MTSRTWARRWLVLERWRAFQLLLAAVAALMLPAACGGAKEAGQAPRLTVAAAASLQPLFRELGERFENEVSGEVVFFFSASGILARQIEQGAPVDVFASADPLLMDKLEAQGLIDPGTRRNYALGRLSLVASREAGTSVTSLEDLLAPQVHFVALANPEVAPYGAAAREALRSLGLWTRLQPKIVYGESVRQALQFVETGNAEAGLVASSIADERVAAVPIDSALHEPIVQVIAVVGTTRQPEASKRFVELVAGPEGAAVLQAHSFTPVSGQGAP